MSSIRKLGIKVPDIVAVFGVLAISDMPLDHQTAIKLAELVLSIYENEHPNDDRPRNAIAAAKAYLANPTDQNLQFLTKARDAAFYVTYDAASCSAYYASCSAYYAASAAYWTAYAAWATCEAANDATNPAYWTAASLNIKRYKINLQDINKTTLKSDSWVQILP